MGPKRTAPEDGSGDTDVKKAKSDSGEVKKGRGRPKLPDELKKKKPTAPSGRGRGRPRKDGTQSKSANAVKKGGSGKRGRPKKAPVAESEEEDKEEEEPEEEPEEEEVVEEVKEIKKPKKAAPKAGKGSTKKRGRPKKQAAEDEDDS